MRRWLLVGADFSALAARCPFLDTLCAEARARLAAGVREVSLRRGRVLFLEGDRPDAVYLVCSGLVRIFVTELDGSETTVRLVGRGELLGELAVIDGGLRSASAIAMRSVVAYRLPAALLAAELPAPGTVGRGILAGLVAVVRENTKRLVIERSQPLESVVATLLFDDPGLLRRVTQGELAGLLGVSRQSLNQILRAWEREGVVGRRDGRMHLTDPAALRARHLVGGSGVVSPSAADVR
ncbi:MAG: Crp/Fnr family transcriptional regulator [Acidimicrobiaceae bacterium]|nr:Crp/Fnr family transcriptional regulator [Acidimicrobiaceae bacterium]